MDPHSPIATKRLLNYLRITFLMLRKGIISKRKLIMDINLMMKRGKLIGKTLGRNIFNCHCEHSCGHGYNLQNYEFSCNNSPNPILSRTKRNTYRNYFPCINIFIEEDNEGPLTTPAVTPTTTTSSPTLCYSPSFSAITSVEDEDVEEECGSELFENNEVDYHAEKFISLFRDHLRRQSRFALLQYEMDYQDMLLRGC